MSYPVKYRERTIEYRQEHTLEETSRTFKVSISTIRKWEKQLKEKGDLKAKVANRSFKKIKSRLITELCKRVEFWHQWGHSHSSCISLDKIRINWRIMLRNIQTHIRKKWHGNLAVHNRPYRKHWSGWKSREKKSNAIPRAGLRQNSSIQVRNYWCITGKDCLCGRNRDR